MWQEHLEEIRKEERKYGDELNDGISEEESLTFIKEAEKELGAVLPKEYVKILETINGLEFNGVILYGADEQLLKEAPARSVNGLIDNNKIWYENEWQKRYLFLGESNISWYVYDLNSKKYCELDNPTGELSEEFDEFEEILDKMLGEALM